jgi:hypothetical protein
MVGSVRLGANADVTATQRYFGEWTTSSAGRQHDDLHFSRSLHLRGHQADVCESQRVNSEQWRGIRGRGGRLITRYLFGALRLADHGRRMSP